MSDNPVFKITFSGCDLKEEEIAAISVALWALPFRRENLSGQGKNIRRRVPGTVSSYRNPRSWAGK